MQGTKKVLLIDDHCVVRRGLAQLINQQPGLCVCGEAGHPKQALTAIAENKPDIIVLDISLGDYNGISLLRDIRDRFQELPILVLSMHDESLYAERSLRAGANGYIMKEKAAEEMIAAINRVVAGNIYLSKEMHNRILGTRVKNSFKPDTVEEALYGLTNRELEILEFIGTGLKTRDIAAALHLSIKTIDAHRANIKRKLGLSNAIELLQYATRWVHDNKFLNSPRSSSPS